MICNSKTILIYLELLVTCPFQNTEDWYWVWRQKCSQGFCLTDTLCIYLLFAMIVNEIWGVTLKENAYSKKRISLESNSRTKRNTQMLSKSATDQTESFFYSLWRPGLLTAWPANCLFISIKTSRPGSTHAHARTYENNVICQQLRD